MPYVTRDDITATPPPDTPIWRYVDILQFLVLLEQRSLHFALLKELEDAWEAALSKRLKDSIIRGLGDKAIPVPRQNSIRRQAESKPGFLTVKNRWNSPARTRLQNKENRG
jgi:hypothetical protein